MITEDYVSRETAKLMEKNGFEGVTNAYYHIWDKRDIICSVQEFSHSEAPHLYVPTPTHQMAMAWLREVHHIAINIGWGEVFEEQYHWWSIVLNMDNGNILYDGDYCASYEETVESTLKYCLENLI